MSLRQEQSTCISEVTIREFQPGDEIAFRTLNEEWIKRYFHMEASDEEVFGDPKEHILNTGGKILFVVAENRCVGCCALRRLGENEYEVAKMAVTPAFQGSGLGRKLLHAVIETGRTMGARRLYLETNHTLTTAIRLYESVGFKHIPKERVTPSFYERADVHMELIFD
jgi:putative acetyltransferase